MTAKPRFLTKSRFKIGCECPTKLYFTGKAEYGNTKLDNSFLEALADGGFQVGALAKVYFGGGTEIETLDVAEAVGLTTELLKQERVTLYEPAIQVGDLLVRVDVLVKNGNHIELIEVKAKSFDPSEENPFYTKRSLKAGKPNLISEWEPYLLDVAFQTYVARKAFPQWKVSPSLMLANNTAKASADGINQRFFLSEVDGRTRVEVAPGTTRSDHGTDLLVQVPVNDEIEIIFKTGVNQVPFEAWVDQLAQAYKKDEMLTPQVGSHCKGCEFRIGKDLKSAGLKSGFDECWQKAAKISVSELSRPFVFDLWNFRKAQKLIDSGVFLMEQIQESDVSPTPSPDEPGLSSSERQWLQVEKVLKKDPKPFLDYDGLSEEMAKWRYPLHFIDFETTLVALPFHQGRRPYEQIAFQFSHHTVSESGLVVHEDEYLNRERGKFPNFDFVRALKNALSKDNGTIFRFSHHENTVLCQILGQLQESNEIDKRDLMAWIASITQSTGDSTTQWTGERTMVDLCDLVKKYFYHPYTNGSNSIKKVLPAVLQASDFVQVRYGKPIYGAAGGIQSKNYQNWQWVRRDSEDKVLDPYKLLPPIFSECDLETLEARITEGSIAEGGAAMTAYARMQFTQMSEVECDRVAKALLQYCELDTFAMVLIYEYWKDEIQKRAKGDRAA